MEDDNLNDATQVNESSGAEKVDKAGRATAGAVKKGKMLAKIIKSLKGLGALGTIAIIAIVIIIVIIIATRSYSICNGRARSFNKQNFRYCHIFFYRTKNVLFW